MSPTTPFDPKAIATKCTAVVQSTIEQMCKITPSQDPTFTPKNIIEYNSRMRVFGMEIFNAPCYISVVNYYFSPEHMKRHEACGAFILYLEESSGGRLLKIINRKLDDEDETFVSAACGDLCKILSENFKNEISQLGYLDLTMSAPQNYKNTVPEGVEFSYEEYIKYETSFYYWKQKVMAVDVTIGPLPEKK